MKTAVKKLHNLQFCLMVVFSVWHAFCFTCSTGNLHHIPDSSGQPGQKPGFHRFT